MLSVSSFLFTFDCPVNRKTVPVMREHHVSVMSLEEYEPNREFVGRNFNAGEIIQLVLKSPSTGRWLPFNYVQMVMMHEYGLDIHPTLLHTDTRLQACTL
jgi:hypothetical protein